MVCAEPRPRNIRRAAGSLRGENLPNPMVSEMFRVGKRMQGESAVGKAIDERAYRYTHNQARGPRTRDWRKSMSDNVALALIVYTGLQIFVTVKALEKGMPSLLPYLLLVILVVAIIPACHWFERRWKDIDDAHAADPALSGDYRRDQALLWTMAIGLPFAIAFGCKAIL